MDRSKIDEKHLKVTGKHKDIDELDVEVKDDVVIVVTKAYGPLGDNLVGISDVTFDGHPAITLLVRADGREGLVHLSPIHGDARKEGFTDIPPGTRCELLCPLSKEPLDLLEEAGDEHGARYYAIYLTQRMSEGAMIAISDIWGHYHSRVIDEFELISEWSRENQNRKG